MKSNDGVNIFSKAAYLTIHIFLKKQMHLDSIFQGNHKYFRKKCSTYFSITKFEISSSLSSSTSLQVFVQQALKSLEERRKREEAGAQSRARAPEHGLVVPPAAAVAGFSRWGHSPADP